jgi:sulfatase maturation enzyme AslB (radical SAM superfamily)
MKKIVLNINDTTYEKLRFEAISEQKDISNLIAERIFHKPFSESVESAFENWMNKEFEKILME